MRQRWWIGVVALVGIVLAVLLFPRPDTGADITVDATSDDPDDEGVASNDDQQATRRDRRERRAGRVGTGPKPGAAAALAARHRPEIVYSSKIIAPWSAIRYVLLKEGTPEAKTLADELGNGVMAELRNIRNAEDVESSWLAAEPKMAEAATKVAASSWGKNETVVKSLDRYRLLLAEFHQAKENGGTAPAPEGETPKPADPAPEHETPPAQE